MKRASGWTVPRKLRAKAEEADVEVADALLAHAAMANQRKAQAGYGGDAALLNQDWQIWAGDCS